MPVTLILSTPEPLKITVPVEARKVCHLLDDEDRALCLADIDGRPIHDASVCQALGHRRCDLCRQIACELAADDGL
jgi:hypothetical protein